MENINLSDEELVGELWHWLIEDNLIKNSGEYDGRTGWNFCSGLLQQNYGIKMSPETIKHKFYSFFKELTGFDIYSKCPTCKNGEIVPRESRYGYFVSCSKFPNCDFKGPKKSRG